MKKVKISPVSIKTDAVQEVKVGFENSTKTIKLENIINSSRNKRLEQTVKTDDNVKED